MKSSKSNAAARGDTPSSFAARWLPLAAGPVAMMLLLNLPAPEGMNPQAWTLVAFATWMVTWWLTEAVPIPVTALLPIPFMPLLGIGEMKPVAGNYAHPLIFLFLGGFILAVAMQKWHLHRRIALSIVSLVGTNPGRVIGGFMLATAFLSMWISNTASTIMMYAVALSVIDFVARKTDDDQVVRNFGVALMLAIAYSATIGGVGTLIGTPPNAFLASFLSSTYGIKIDFFAWMTLGMPIVFVMLPLAWITLTKIVFPSDQLRIGDVSSVIRTELNELGAMTPNEKKVAIVFLAAAAAWILRRPLVEFTGLPINDTSVALIAATTLFVLPAGGAKSGAILDWEDTKNLPWGVLLLFGGGLALASAFQNTGLAEWIGQAAADIQVSTWLMMLIVITGIVYVTEITSNTASTATFLPILGAVAIGLQLDPRLLTIPAAIAASMAFMMPVASPPNAIVFSYEQLNLPDMLRAGFLLNILAIIVTFTAMHLFAGVVFAA